MSIDTSDGHPAMDYDEHVRTYNGFMLFTKISTIVIVVLLAGMAVFLV
ncbi:MAG: aa3-type cytochrome c oxidase subunit IV [Hyphomicrobiaceae bacterium]